MKNNKGFTLVELLVSMTLTAAFLLSAMAVLSTGIRVYTRATNAAHAQVVADTLLDTVKGQIRKAVKFAPDSSDQNHSYIELHADFIQFVTGEGKVEKITTEDGKLVIQEDGALVEGLYGENVYQNFRIKALDFEPFGGDSAQNLMKITIELENSNIRSFFSFSQVTKCPIEVDSSTYFIDKA